MRSRSRGILPVIGGAWPVLAVFLMSAPASGSLPVAPAGPFLEETLLPALGRVARLYRDTALRFTCNETIRDRGLGGHTFEYRYVYLFDKKSGFADHREPRGSPASRALSSRRKGPSHHMRRAYSWAFIFSAGESKLHRFRLEGRDEMLGRPALKVVFDPTPPYREGVNDWFGIATVTDFTEVKNGMRFPGKVTISHDRTWVGYGQRKVGGQRWSRYVSGANLYRVEQEYDDYRFFSVRSEQQIRRFVLENSGGDGPP